MAKKDKAEKAGEKPKKSKKKLVVLALPVLLLVGGGGAYEMVLKPKPVQAKPKLPGVLATLSDPFVLNLAAGRYAKVTVAVLLDEPAPKAAADATTGPAVPQEAAVRAVVTDMLTDLPAAQLVDRTDRHALERRLVKAIDATTDNKVTDVLLTDLTIQ
jgi:flagellar basal body-associated protein FliL